MSKNIVNYPEAEKSVLGSIMYNQRVSDTVKSILRAEDFYQPENRDIYHAVALLLERKEAVNVLSVHNELKKRGMAQYTLEYLQTFLDYQADHADAQTFAMQISEASGIRELSTFIDTKSRSYNDAPVIDLHQELEELNKIHQVLTSRGVNDTAYTEGALIDAYLEFLDTEHFSYPLLGLPELDDNIMDFFRKELLVFAGRPGMGKTTALLQSGIAQMPRLIPSGKKVGLLSMEMQLGAIVNRAIAQLLSINSRNLRAMNSGQFQMQETRLKALRAISQAFVIDSDGPWTMESIERKIKKMVYTQNVEIVYVDYIGLIKSSGSFKGNRQEEVASYSRRFKTLAGELDIPIVIASQLNRGVEHRVSNRPILADLRESGAVEQDASIVVFFYPNLDKLNSGRSEGEKMTNADVEAYLDATVSVPTIVEIAKHRNGPVFPVEVMFEKRYNRFDSLINKNATHGELPFNEVQNQSLPPVTSNKREVFGDDDSTTSENDMM